MNELKPGQIDAIRRTLSLGRTLQYEPIAGHIVGDIRTGMTFLEIVIKYNITNKYRVTENIARGSIGRMLRGYSGSQYAEAFEGTMDLTELDGIVNEHTGMHMTNMTKEEKRKFVKRAREGKGLVDWTNEERQSVYELSQRPEYQNGTLGKRVNAIAITKEVNERFHNGKEVRTNIAIRQELYRSRKRNQPK